MRVVLTILALSAGACFAQADWTYGQPLTDVGIYKYSNGKVLWYFDNGEDLLEALTAEYGFAGATVLVTTEEVWSGERHRLKRQHVLTDPDGNPLGTISVYSRY